MKARRFGRQSAAESIFTRLESLGFQAEINYFGRDYIAGLNRAVFNTTKRLTDKKWDRLRPQLQKEMNDCRIHRLEETVYIPRRALLFVLYYSYVQWPASSGAAVDLLPHEGDFAHFAPIDAIIKLPEGINVNVDTTSSANIGDPKPLKPAERLRLASSVFQLRQSGRLIMYPDILYLPIFNDYGVGGRPWSLMDERGTAPLVEFFTGAARVIPQRPCDMQSLSRGTSKGVDVEKRSKITLLVANDTLESTVL
ncbi:hypothetical protein BU15DRAFT_83909 [Melanogaster broomeanus]|nr:hypothetical protein BU15DRAFT_83909 [Melanogaster broomeanus]